VSARILLVEDEEAIADAVSYALETDGETAVAAATRNADAYDLVVLDVMLPRLSGFEVCRRVRATSVVPILMLTARSAEIDRVLGLEAGADDYVAKPFSMPELISRVRAILRRRRLDRGEAEPTALEVGRLRLDLVDQTVRLDGKAIPVTASEFRLLALLARRPDEAVTRREIVEHLWRSSHVGAERTSDVHVKNLRRKLEVDPARPKLLVTVRGVGYMLRRE
jgi:two-component system response regulator RegX3